MHVLVSITNLKPTYSRLSGCHITGQLRYFDTSTEKRIAEYQKDLTSNMGMEIQVLRMHFLSLRRCFTGKATLDIKYAMEYLTNHLKIIWRSLRSKAFISFIIMFLLTKSTNLWKYSCTLFYSSYVMIFSPMKNYSGNFY